MKELLAFIIKLISSALLGLNFIQAEEKPFTQDTYYIGNNNAEGADPDYKGIYMNHVGGSLLSGQESDKTPKSLSSDERLFVPKTPSDFKWFWIVNDSDIIDRNDGERDIKIKVMNQDEVSLKDEIKKYNSSQKGVLSLSKATFELAGETKLISPVSSYLVARSSSSEGIYPKDQKTKGKYIQFIYKDSKFAYKVTYEDMIMWWTDMKKPKPDDYKDGDKSLPLYYHSVDFSEDDIFDSGFIVGLSGDTGMPKSKRGGNKTYVTISIERSTVKDGDIEDIWSPVRLAEFFKLGGK